MTGWAIARVIPLWFDATRARGLTTAFELRVRERPGREPVRLTLQIDNGSAGCTVEPTELPERWRRSRSRISSGCPSGSSGGRS